ncbi:uncharacterized protein sha [Venturia canescens]|uniref:uncharacterized protein sha n=1 Tax=Venturia canescens TaxID=32260 RepID=UPI001C9C522A|nr:uncharacterized protein LOC122418149 [Venturia canescens]
MPLPVLVLSSLLQLLAAVSCDELSVIRHVDGDIFTAEGSCNGACAELSSGTGSSYSRATATSTTGISITNGTCVCQCNGALPVFREDLHICVSDIHECNVAGFVSSSGHVEKVPYIFLPQRGQIIYPQAEIRFEGVTTPVCGIAGSQQLGKSGWIELRNLSNAEPPFRLFRDEGRTFLQWIGEDGLRDTAEGKLVLAKLVCRDASPSSSLPEVFAPCVAFRVAGSPSKSNVREVTFAATRQPSQGLSVVEYAAIGVSSILLALIYVASVSLYLHSRKARRKCNEEPEVAITGGRDGAGLVKNNPLLVATRHFESDTNSGPSDDDGGDELGESDAEQGFENPSYCSQQVTSALVHPQCMFLEHSEALFNNGNILGERIPEEDVRIVETIENTYQQETPVLPGTQRRKLYFNPAYFERQLLLAPPPAAIEFLMKIREVISIAKHKMTAKKFVPTLTGIPEEESSSERCSSVANKNRAGSVQGSVTRSRRSQRCTGCPGCTEGPLKNLALLPDAGRSMIGENRVRAWLEDVKPPERRWKDGEDARHNFQDNSRVFARSFDKLEKIGNIDLSRGDKSDQTKGKGFATWKENPPMLRTFQNIARSEILGEDDRHSISKRSTKSMFEESNYDRYYRTKKSASSSPRREENRDNEINAKVRKAIENSFIKQMEENATIEDRQESINRQIGSGPDGKEEGAASNEEEENKLDSKKSVSIGTQKRWKKSRAPGVPSKELPDMINQLPLSKIPAKKIMDAVIKEMVDVKALEHQSRVTDPSVYEIDSLERTHRRSCQGEARKSAKIGSAKDKIGKPIEEIGKKSVDEQILRRNYYNNLPELLTSRREGYSLVSEVYVNDGYASPAGSDDSGPEIRYEAENPGHLTIKVQDSPENYVKQDESEYEPDTLDRKPMRLKINGDVSYDRDTTSESYVDSLERPRHILLRSKGSFRDDDNSKNGTGSLQRGYGSLREIYEARLRTNLKDSSFMGSTKSLNGELDNPLAWKKCKYLTPDTRQAKRQRKPQNQPDVVPLPPSEEIYQKPKPPRRVEYKDAKAEEQVGLESIDSKNELDRSKSEAGDPTASDGSPVFAQTPENGRVGKLTREQSEEVKIAAPSRLTENDGFGEENGAEKVPVSPDSNPSWLPGGEPPWKADLEKRSRRHLPADCGSPNAPERFESVKKSSAMSLSGGKTCADFLEPGRPISMLRKSEGPSRKSMTLGKVEDSGYLSSTDSNESQKQLLRHDNGSVSETDETESMCDGASESGAESVGTDSVFFGNFRRLSDLSNFSKSVDSGVDFSMRNTFFKPFADRSARSSKNLERTSVQTSDSESGSFVTVLSPTGESRRNSLVL